MTEKTIKLKMKKRGMPKVYLPFEQAHAIILDEDKETAWNLFKALANNPVQEHDKDFMELIVNWVPQEGQSMMDTARWSVLALKIDKLDKQKEETLELTGQQVDMIFSKLRNPSFKIRSASTGLFKFLSELEDTLGQQIVVTKEEEKDE